jgi:drug/metabolite transporter (DMT)-like permease
LILSGGRLHLEREHLPGYLLMAAAGLTWASYSLLTKRLPPFPTGTVGAFCLVAGLLALSIYYLSGGSREFPIAALTASNWLNLFLIGLGPMGSAFFTWDAALKRGDPRMIGALAYLTPLTSTLVLVSVGGKALTWVSGIAMLLIIGGAVIGSLDLFRKGNNL